MDKRSSIPPPGRGRPRTDTPGAAPTSRTVRSPPAEEGPGGIHPGSRQRAERCVLPPAEGSRGRIPKGSEREHPTTGQREASGKLGPRLGHWARRRAPLALSALLRRRALLTTRMGYRHQRALYPPRGDNNPITVPTTRVRDDNPLAVSPTRVRAGRARAPHARNPPTPNNARPRGARRRPASPLGDSLVLVPLPRVTHTRTPIYETCAAHKGLIPPLCAALCFLIPSLVCGSEGDRRTTGSPSSR